MTSVLATIQKRDVFWDPQTNVMSWTSGLTIDADGSPRAYGPDDKGLDLTRYAGRPGKWWGVATVSGRADGQPVIQGPKDPYPGLWVSTTAYQRTQYDHKDYRRYLDSEKIPFVVLPSFLRGKVKPILLGARAFVKNLDNGKCTCAMVGDLGPDNHLGEGSIKLARLLGINPDPRTGGTSAPVIHVTIEAGRPARFMNEYFPLQPKSGTRANTELAQLYAVKLGADIA